MQSESIRLCEITDQPQHRLFPPRDAVVTV
jgi:hypothetical protein